MASAVKSPSQPGPKPRSSWVSSEDWWSVIIGLFMVVATWAFYAAGSPLNILKKAIPADWPRPLSGPTLPPTGLRTCSCLWPWPS